MGEAAHPGPGGAPTTAERVSQLEVLERELTRLEGYAQHTRGAVREEDEAAADHLRQALAHLRNNVNVVAPPRATCKCVRCGLEFRAAPEADAEEAAAAERAALENHVKDVHLLGSLVQEGAEAERAPVIQKLIERGAALRDELLGKAARDVNPARVKELLAEAGIGDTEAGSQEDARKAIAVLTKAKAAERVDAMFRLLLAVIASEGGALAAQSLVMSDGDELPDVPDVHRDPDGVRFDRTPLGQRLLEMPAYKERNKSEREMLWCSVAFAAPRSPATPFVRN